MKKLLLSMTLLLLCGTAYAQNDAVITGDLINKFYGESFAIQKQEPEKFIKFLSDHTTPDAQFSMVTTTHVQDKTPKQESATISRDKMIDMLKKSLTRMTIDDLNYKIISLNIAADKKSALLSDETTMTARLKEGTIHLESQSTCNDKLVLSHAGAILIAQSDCKEESYITAKVRGRH